ncbi:MAG: septum formation initiator family protein [Muribaculaceae bacterium]|nr:septum formation initiator family protein [Muribaculaceae bacterium]
MKFFKRPNWIPRWLHLPFIVFIAFVVMLLFFGDNSYIKINKLKKEINSLKAEIKVTQDSTRFYDHKISELNTDKETLEKLARERYNMKKDNEEIFYTPDIP